MNDILLVFLSLSFSGSLVALILFSLKPIIKNKISQRWQYYIWLIVILRFMLPFTPQSSIWGEITLQFQNISNPPTVADTNLEQNIYHDNSTQQYQNLPVSSQSNKAELPAQIETSQPTAFWSNILSNIWLIWIGATIILFVHKLTSYRSFVRFVNVGANKVTDTHIQEIYRNELAAAKSKRQLPLYVNSQVTSPMLVGVFRPALIITVLNISDDELRHIFRHELTHYKRHDFVYKWIVQIALCLHWFNPIVYLIVKQINRSCELSCDESVIKHMDEYSRITYGDALMASLQAQSNFSDTVVSMHMSENGKLIKERLDAIMLYKKKSVLTVVISVMLFAVLLCGAAFTGAYTAVSAAKQDSTYDSECDPYLPFGITVSTGADGRDILHYNGQRVRLLVDWQEDKSFNLFISDKLGTVDLNVVRNKQNKITGIQKMDKDTADELLDEYGNVGNSAVQNNQNQVTDIKKMNNATTEELLDKIIIIDNPSDKADSKNTNIEESYPFRLTMTELPADLQQWIDQSGKSSGIFVVLYNERYYVYCNTTPGEITWRPTIGSDTLLEIYDIKRTGDGYALFSFPLSDTLTVSYNDKSLYVTKETVQTVPNSKVAYNSDIAIETDQTVLDSDFTYDSDVTTRAQHSTLDKSTVFEIENGKVAVSFSISNIAESTEGENYICLGQIPNINNAKHIIYTADAESGNSMFVAMGTDDRSVVKKHSWCWYNFVIRPNSKINVVWENSAKGLTMGSDPTHTGNYYLYVGTVREALTNITGTIIIEY